MIPLVKPFFGSEELEAVKKTLESGWVAGQGPAGKAFENAFAQKFGFHNAIAVNNCTAALHLALLALDVKKGDEVLVADYTYPATGHAVAYCGARPVFVDVHEDSYNIDVKDAERKVTSATKAIIPVHAFGQAADMNAVRSFAKKHGLAVIEDAACAAGAKREDKFVGELGDVGCFSFHARKGITTGEGGMVVTASSALAEKARMLSCFGIRSAFDRQEGKFNVPVFTKLGYNYKLSDILAAIGVEQLKKLDAIVERKRALVKLYRSELESVPQVTPPFEDPRGFHVYQTFACLLEEGIDRNKLVHDLAAAGVGAQIGTYASHLQPVYKAPADCPVSRGVFERSLALPLFASMREEEVSQVVKILKGCLKSV